MKAPATVLISISRRLETLNHPDLRVSPGCDGPRDMSLSVALQYAVSGLNATQAQLQVVSSNIANALKVAIGDTLSSPAYFGAEPCDGS